jgi:hypothetical protein
MKDFAPVFHFMSSIRQQWTWIDQWFQQYMRTENEVLSKAGTVLAANVPRKKRQAELIRTMVDLRALVEKMGFVFEPLSTAATGQVVAGAGGADCAVGVPVEHQLASSGPASLESEGHAV